MTMLSLTRYQFTINWRLENVRQLHLQVFDWRTNNMRFVDLKTPRIVLSSSLINRSLISKWLRNQMISVWIGSCKFYQRKVQVKVRKFMSTYNTCFTIECTSCGDKRDVLDTMLRTLQNSHITLLFTHF